MGSSLLAITCLFCGVENCMLSVLHTFLDVIISAYWKVGYMSVSKMMERERVDEFTYGCGVWLSC